MIPQKHACIDLPELSDYRFLEVFGASEAPEIVDLGKTIVYNQGEAHTPDTTYACTCYSAIHCVNDGNYRESGGFEENKNPVPVWKKAITRGADINTGWSLQGATKLCMDMGYIAGYTLCRGIDEVKQALARGQLIQTGSREIDWNATKKDNIVVSGKSYGHAFEIVGYDDTKKLLKLKNSYGKEVYDNGYFYLRYKDFGLLFSCYAYADKVNEDIKVVQSIKRRENAIKMGWWNGERANEILTRYEASVIAMRVGKTVKESKIWNGKNRNLPVTRQEFFTMLTRATGKHITFVYDKNATITRGVASEWCSQLK